MAVIVFVIGLIIGSFLNVVIFRVPRNQSIVSPPSHCPECNYKLGVLDLIPIISYLVLRGKCRKCGAVISIRYPLVELITGLIFLLNYILIDDIISILAGFILSSILIGLTIIDIDFKILPDSMTVGGMVVGLILSIFRIDFHILESLAGILLAGGLLFLVAYFSKGGLGGGDIKMMAMVGSFSGPIVAVVAIFLGAVLGLLASLPGIISGNLKMKSQLPFGPFLAIGSMILWFWGEQIFNWYLSLIL